MCASYPILSTIIALATHPTMYSRNVTFVSGILLVLILASGVTYFLSHSFKQNVVSTPNVNTVTGYIQPTCKDLDEPWPQSVFKDGTYKNPVFGFEVDIPAGLFLQNEDHSQKDCTPPSATFGSRSVATFGDNGKHWRITIESLSNPDSLDVQAWMKKNTAYDVPFLTRTFGKVQTMYGEYTPAYISEDDYKHIVFLTTGEWVQIVTYFDKVSTMPRHADFEKLISSVKAIVSQST